MAGVINNELEQKIKQLSLPAQRSLISLLDSRVVIPEATVRRKRLRVALGTYATLKKYVKCPHCQAGPMSVRDRRKHIPRCPVLLKK